MWVTQDKPIIAFGAVLFSLLTFLVSCEEPIDSPVELIEPRLVATSTFAPGQMVEVRLGATQSITEVARFLEVRDANVFLYEGQTLLEELQYRAGIDGGRNFHTTVDFKPEVGRRYSIWASARGFTPISGESAIPTSIPLTTLKVSNLSVLDVGSYYLYDFVLTVDYEDPEAHENFYDLRISQQVIPFRVDAAGDTTFYDAVSKGVQAPGAPFGAPVSAQSSVLVMDKPGPEGVEVHLQLRVNPEQELLGDLVAELRTVSEPYFQFQRNIQEVGSVHSGLSERRVNSYTNIREGFGVFAGYSRVFGRVNILGD